MSVKDQLAAIERYLLQAKSEDEKLEKGIKSAAPKVRASLLEIGKIVSEGRKLALDHGKAIPVKKRAPKVESKSDEELPESSPVLERQITQAIDSAIVSESPTIRKPRGRKPKQPAA